MNVVKLAKGEKKIVEDLLNIIPDYYHTLLVDKEIISIPKMPELKGNRLFIFNEETAEELLDRVIHQEDTYLVYHHKKSINSLNKKLVKAQRFVPNSVRFIKSLEKVGG